MIWGVMRHARAVRDFPEEILGRTGDKGLEKEALRGPVRGFLSRIGVKDRPREVWTSPAPRSLHTACLITQGLPQIPVLAKIWLNERDYGTVIRPGDLYGENLSFEARMFVRPDGGGEQIHEVVNRVYDGLGKESSKGVLIVTHDIIAQVIYSVFNGRTFKEVYQGWTLPEGHYWRPGFGTEVRRVE